MSLYHSHQSRSLRALLFVLAGLTGTLFAEESPKKPWGSKTELSAVSANGNSNADTASAKEVFTYEWTRVKAELEAGGLGARSEGRVTAEEYYAGEKLSYALSARNYLFEKVRWDKNRFAGIEDRYDSTVGFGREIHKTESAKWIAELGGGYVKEDRTVGPNNDFASGRAYTKYEHIFTPTANVSQDLEYVHNFEDSEDFRVKTETALLSALSTNLALKVSYVWKHVGEPPPGFHRNDTITSVALVATY